MLGLLRSQRTLRPFSTHSAVKKLDRRVRRELLENAEKIGLNRRKCKTVFDLHIHTFFI